MCADAESRVATVPILVGVPEQFEVMGNDDVLTISVTSSRPEAVLRRLSPRKTGRIYHHAGRKREARTHPRTARVDRLTPRHADVRSQDAQRQVRPGSRLREERGGGGWGLSLVLARRAPRFSRDAVGARRGGRSSREYGTQMERRT